MITSPSNQICHSLTCVRANILRKPIHKMVRGPKLQPRPTSLTILSRFLQMSSFSRLRMTRSNVKLWSAKKIKSLNFGKRIVPSEKVVCVSFARPTFSLQASQSATRSPQESRWTWRSGTSFQCRVSDQKTRRPVTNWKRRNGRFS